MPRVGNNILGISELKWTRMGEFNPDDHYISTVVNGVDLIDNKRVLNAVLEWSLKNDRKISVCVQGNWYNIIVIQIYAPITNAEEDEAEKFYDDLEGFLEIVSKKDGLLSQGTGKQNWEVKIPEITEKYGLGVQNGAGES